MKPITREWRFALDPWVPRASAARGETGGVDRRKTTGTLPRRALASDADHSLTILDMTSVFPVDPAFFGTVAQVIPTLMLASAVEHRFLSGAERSTDDDGSASSHWEVGACAALASIGVVCALIAMATGTGERLFLFATFGVFASLVLVLHPIWSRANRTLASEHPKYARLVGTEPVGPFVITVFLIGVVIAFAFWRLEGWAGLVSIPTIGIVFGLPLWGVVWLVNRAVRVRRTRQDRARDPA